MSASQKKYDSSANVTQSQAAIKDIKAAVNKAFTLQGQTMKLSSASSSRKTPS
jgi:hypothetical protein